MKPLKSDKLTIVIPCKNELFYIGGLLNDLANQLFIGDILDKIVIADKSNDGTQCVIDLKIEKYPQLPIVMTEGGFVSTARNNGALLCDTEYILFMDADVRLFSRHHIYDCFNEMKDQNLKLFSCKLKSYSPSVMSKLAFGVYNIIHSVLIKKYPFAIGGFMMLKYEDFLKFGMFDEMTTNSEDFLFSQNYKPSEFGVSKYHFIGQPDRRFQTIGYFGMIKHLLVNFINFIRYGSDYFYKQTNYWDGNFKQKNIN